MTCSPLRGLRPTRGGRRLIEKLPKPRISMRCPRASEISRDRVEDARNVLKEGDEVSAMIINVDRKTRSIQLSIKAKDNADQQEAMQRLSQSNERETAGTTSLGALLRAKLDTQKE